MTATTHPTPADLGADFARRDGFMKTLGIERMETGPGSCELRMPVRAEHMNFNGTCHGGAIFSLADGAFGMASNSHGILSAGIDAHVTYQAAALEGDVLTAKATEISRSRKIAVYRVDVTGKSGDIIAGFTGTVYITGRANHTLSQG